MTFSTMPPFFRASFRLHAESTAISVSHKSRRAVTSLNALHDTAVTTNQTSLFTECMRLSSSNRYRVVLMPEILR